MNVLNKKNTIPPERKTKNSDCQQPVYHRIWLWENLQESPIFDGKNYGFL